jgi:hypothetical protein
MAKKENEKQVAEESLFAEEVFDIIELTCADIDLLANAFDLIADVCSQIDNPHIVIHEENASGWVH